MKQWYFECSCGLIFYNEHEATEHCRDNSSHDIRFNDAHGNRETRLKIIPRENLGYLTANEKITITDETDGNRKNSS